MRNTKIGLFGSITNIDFFKYIKVSFILSAVLLVLSVVYPIINGYNLGIDFRGGVFIDIANNPDKPLSYAEERLQEVSINNYSIRTINDEDFQIQIGQSSLDNIDVNNYISTIRESLSEYDLLQIQFVGPSISTQLLKEGLIALLFSFIAILIYLWIRYNWQFGVIGIITLTHDTLISLLLLSIFRLELSVSSIAAILTVVGYSINDTVVLFDQVRENIRKYIKEDTKVILNKSINQVLSRSILTSLTIVVVLLSIFFMGGESLKSFSFTLLVGIIVGTYSSIFLATPMLSYLGNLKSRELSKQK